MKQFLTLMVAMFLLLTAACIFGSSDPEYIYDQYRKSVGSFIEEYYDNGCYVCKIYLVPREYSPDHFYIVESPEMLDSVFESISYHGEDTPRLETLFPEGGKLLILNEELGQRNFNAYEISASNDTIIIDVTSTYPSEPYDPGWYPLVIPVGFVTSDTYSLIP